jgi:hypothetical protein
MKNKKKVAISEDQWLCGLTTEMRIEYYNNSTSPLYNLLLGVIDFRKFTVNDSLNSKMRQYRGPFSLRKTLHVLLN